MSMKQEIEMWVAALEQYDNHDFEGALRRFDEIADNSKILFNCGMIHATLGEHPQAVECFQRAIKRDSFFAVAYFQQGVSNFLMGDFEEALANFNDTLIYLRGNKYINYEQLGLKYKLHSCEVLFNRGLCYVYLKQREIGMSDLRSAAKEKETPEHDVIDEAIQEGAEDFTVFSIGVGVVYRPNSAKVKNLKARDYLGRARVVAQADQQYISATDAKRAAMLATAERSGDPELSYYGSNNLIKPHLSSRSRQQSEPPIHRNVFPPTPPPESENDKIRATVCSEPATEQMGRVSPDRYSTRSYHSTAGQQMRPEPLKIPHSSFTSLQNSEPPAPRLGTMRSASERPRESLRRGRDQQPRRLFMETTPMHLMPNGNEEQIEEHPDEGLYEEPAVTQSRHRRTQSNTDRPLPKGPGAPARSRSRGPRRDYFSIAEEDEEMQDSLYKGTPESENGPRRHPIDTSPLTYGSPSSGRSRTQSERPGAAYDRRNRSSSRPRQSNNGFDGHSSNASLIPPQRRHYDHLFDHYDPRGPQRRPSFAPPDLRTLRIKVHFDEQETRYIMLSSSSNSAGGMGLSSTSSPASTTSVTPGDLYSFAALVERVREKFKLSGGHGSAPPFKLKVRDEDGDLITLADQDDWDVALTSVRKDLEQQASPSEEASELSAGASSNGGGVMGKMEVWVFSVNHQPSAHTAPASSTNPTTTMAPPRAYPTATAAA